MIVRNLITAVVLLAIQTTPILAQRPDPNSPHVKAVDALTKLLEQKAVDQQKINELLSNNASLKTELAQIRKLTVGLEVADIQLFSATDGLLTFEEPNLMLDIKFTLSSTDPAKVTSLQHTKKTFGAGGDSDLELTWDNVESVLDKSAEEWFAGCVLISRNGKTYLSKGFGMANRKKGIPNAPDTIFAIGSAPIDFTHAGILLLRERGELRLDDPISNFFDNVPNDKKMITVRHLMTGQSGLPDFHDRPHDKNPDHSWVSRDESVRRIFENELKFDPGKGEAHSHSAWGLLAAIIEVQSGMSYPEFTRKFLFKPAGMTSTGFFGESFNDDRVAVGYGPRKSSDPNSPPNWGKTSWLVMGSGGQVSTLSDILKWERAMRNGSILSPESEKLYHSNSGEVSMDGDMFGFEFMHSKNPDSMFLLISNAIDSREKRNKFTALGRSLYSLTKQPVRRGGKYSFGVVMAISPDDGVLIREVVKGSAAEKAGLQTADKLIAVNGQDLGAENMDLLYDAIESGEKFEIEISRNQKTHKTNVRPTKL